MPMRRLGSLLRSIYVPSVSCSRISKNIMISSLSTMSSANFKKVLTMDTINPNVKAAEYAVRGAIVMRAEEHRQALLRGEKRPFNEIISCNIGNPMEVGLQPMTFARQIMCILSWPELALPGSDGEKLFPVDVLKRARQMLQSTPGGLGAYSHSKGLPFIRQDVAKFIQRRDGFPADPDSIFLSDGASSSIAKLLNILIRDSNDGVMIPIPQYPLYTATIALLGGTPVPYYLDEHAGWSITAQDLRSALYAYQKNGIDVRCLCVINPGNPTGQILTKEAMKDLIQICADENLVLLADEVYQDNNYTENRPWLSFRKVMMEMDSKVNKKVELASFHSVSKGFMGECGYRGGYMELVNFDQRVADEFYKLSSISLCSNISGQVMLDLSINPPMEGDVSYPLYIKEKQDRLASLKRRALRLVDALNQMEGVSCNPAEGAMYAFPQICLPENAIKAAKASKLAPDAYYCTKLLDATGVVVVPGSGFRQKDGTYHFRTTFLPSEEKIGRVIDLCSTFHKQFMNEYR